MRNTYEIPAFVQTNLAFSAAAAFTGHFVCCFYEAGVGGVVRRNALPCIFFRGKPHHLSGSLFHHGTAAGDFDRASPRSAHPPDCPADPPQAGAKNTFAARAGFSALRGGRNHLLVHDQLRNQLLPLPVRAGFGADSAPLLC